MSTSPAVPVTEGSPIRLSAVLLISDDPQLSWQWSRILTQAGLQVIVATSAEANLTAKSGSFPVALVCHSVAPAQVFKLVDSLRRHCPRTRLVAMLGAMHSSGYPWLFDECLEPLCGPRMVIDAIKRSV